MSLTDRRRFLLGTGALFIASHGSEALPDVKLRQVASISFADAKSTAPLDQIFKDVLHRHGWVEDKNVRFEFGRAVGNLDRFVGLAKAFAREAVDVIVTSNNIETGLVQQVTTAIPIVMLLGADPVGAGLAKSLARPGGNVTGTAFDPTPQIFGKHLELLKDLAPETVRVIVVRNPNLPGGAAYWEAASEAARRLGLVLDSLTVEKAADVAPVLSALSRSRQGSAVFIFGDPITYSASRQFAEAALNSRLPLISVLREYTVAGALASYGPSFPDLVRRAAVYVDKILRGAKPGDLPIEQPTKLELVINLKTVRSLDLTVPAEVLLRADEIIE